MPLTLSELETGDVVLYYNRHSIISRAIAYATSDDVSHVGMVVVNPPWRPDLRGVYLIEANREDFVDAEDHQIKTGVELVPLIESMRAYPTHDIHVRQLKTDKSFTTSELIAMHANVHNKPYDLDPVHWMYAWFGKVGPERTDRRYWCSALVARCYVELKLLPNDYNWTYTPPSVFGENTLPLINSELGPLLPLDDAEMSYVIDCSDLDSELSIDLDSEPDDIVTESKSESEPVDSITESKSESEPVDSITESESEPVDSITESESATEALFELEHTPEEAKPLLPKITVDGEPAKIRPAPAFWRRPPPLRIWRRRVPAEQVTTL